MATLWASNPIAGGWHVAVFDSGPAVGTVAMLSTADRLLTFFNASTLAITKQVTLTGIPFRMAKDLTHGSVVIALVDQADVLTTFVSVNATTGVITPLTSNDESPCGRATSLSRWHHDLCVPTDAMRSSPKPVEAVWPLSEIGGAFFI